MRTCGVLPTVSRMVLARMGGGVEGERDWPQVRIQHAVPTFLTPHRTNARFTFSTAFLVFEALVGAHRRFALSLGAARGARLSALESGVTACPNALPPAR